MKKLFLIWGILSLTLCTYGQQIAKLSGEVLSADGLPLEFVNVTLHHAADSSFIAFAISDEKGHFEFTGLSALTGFIVASYIGNADYVSEIFSLEAKQQLTLSTIQFTLSTTELEAVEVTAKRQMFEIRPDKIVFNVAGTINAGGGNALELLRKSPGVVVTNGEDITLLGQSGVRIFLDGKPSPLRGRDLAAYLRTLPASEIESIEIITNPSSRYDAEGSAGIINIRLKRDENLGLNSNLYLGYSTGVKGWRYGSLSANYRNKKINIFGNYNLNVGENISTRQLRREQGNTLFDQSNISLTEWTSNKFQIGMDIYMSERSTLGLKVDGSDKDFDWVDQARTAIHNNDRFQYDSLLISEYRIVGERRNLLYNLNYRYRNPDGASLEIDLDYSNFRNPNIGDQPNFVLDHTGYKVLSQRNYSFNNPTDIELLSIRGDLEYNLLAGQLGTGIKSTTSITDNLFDFYAHENGSPILDVNRSNRFVYTERVTAAYINYNRELGKAGFQIGLRGEHTFSNGDLTSGKQIDENNVSRTYFDLFPSASFNYKIDPKNSIQFSYSRRINRPSYYDLNPFEIQKDEYSFERGNPYLTPEYTDKIQITHGFNYRLYSSLGYSRTKDLMVRIRDTLGDSRTIRQWVNLAEKKHYSLNIGLAHEFAEWWDSYHSITAYYVKNYGAYGAGQVIDVEAKAINFYGQHAFRLPKSFSFEISGWFNSPSVWEANVQSRSLWSIDLGFQKKLWNKRGRIKVSVSDIFRTSGWYGVSRLDGLTITSSGYSDSRRLYISFNYLFGNDRVKSKKHKSGLEDERERLETEESDRG